MNTDMQTRLLAAVDHRFDDQITFLSELTAHPSTRVTNRAHRISWRAN